VSRVLVVDIGNTTTRAGLWQAERVAHVRTGRTSELHSVADVDVLAEPLLEGLDAEEPGADIALCSVVPQAEAMWLEWAASAGAGAFVVSGRTPAPLENRYSRPEQLGPDRLAAAVGAARRLGAPVIVVSLGTATVVDLVSGEGRFLGGAIAAGLKIELAALAEGTAALPTIALAQPERVLGVDTEQCLLSGAVHGTAALIEGMVSRFQEALGSAAPVALTGGHAELVSPHLRVEHEVFPDLVLDGVGAIWEYNRGAD
jgi:type III pantothenate kinase